MRAPLIRGFLFLEAMTFSAAAMIHFGVLMDGYEHQEAGIAESVIAGVLFLGLALTWIQPAWTSRVGLAAQAFALFGTLIGISTIVVGIGPRSAPDIAYHAAIVLVLVWGIIVARRARSEDPRHRI